MADSGQHHVEISTGRTRLSDGTTVTTHQALCDCGYAGPPYERKIYAMNDGDEHIVAMAGERG